MCVEWNGMERPAWGGPRVLKSAQRVAPLKEVGSSLMQKDCGMSCSATENRQGYVLYIRSTNLRPAGVPSLVNGPRGAQTHRDPQHHHIHGFK
jgi:hypothetical protein